MRGRPTLIERFWSKFTRDAATGCWQWMAATSGGYGKVSVGGSPRYAHRVAYELLVGPIPDGLDIDHLCRNRACVNPAHMEPVPRSVNVLRGVSPAALNAGKLRCCRGHEFTPENTLTQPSGARACRRCKDLFGKAPRSAVPLSYPSVAALEAAS